MLEMPSSGNGGIVVNVGFVLFIIGLILFSIGIMIR